MSPPLAATVEFANPIFFLFQKNGFVEFRRIVFLRQLIKTRELTIERSEPGGACACSAGAELRRATVSRAELARVAQ